MLDVLVARATAEWGSWYPGETDPGLAPMLLAGGPAHRDRVSVLLFPGAEGKPRVIMKIGFTPLEGEFLAAEFEAMDRLRPQLPAHLQDGMPRALDLYRTGHVTALAATVIAGDRLLVPRLTGEVAPQAVAIMDSFFERAFAFSRAVAASTSSHDRKTSAELAKIATRFADRFLADDQELADRVSEFHSAIEAADIEWRPAWQHQDVAVGNVLDDRGRLRFVDWEHAGPGCVPWFDVAFAPVVTSHLARRVDRIESVEEAARGVLGPDTAIGAVLRARMEEVWDYPLPLPWGVTLTAMEGAMRRLDDGREGSPEWVELVRLMMCDEDFRSYLAWLAPQW